MFALIFALLPFLFSFLFFAYLMIKQKGFHFDKFIQNNSFCFSISYFLLQSSIFNSILELFKCKNIDGKNYISSHLSESCQDQRYKNWINYLVLPSFCFYAIAIPGFFLYFIVRNKKNLHKKEIMKYIEFSLNSLGKTKFYW